MMLLMWVVVVVARGPVAVWCSCNADGGGDGGAGGCGGGGAGGGYGGSGDRLLDCTGGDSGGAGGDAGVGVVGSSGADGGADDEWCCGWNSCCNLKNRKPINKTHSNVVKPIP